MFCKVCDYSNLNDLIAYTETITEKVGIGNEKPRLSVNPQSINPEPELAHYNRALNNRGKK